MWHRDCITSAVQASEAYMLDLPDGCNEDGGSHQSVNQNCMRGAGCCCRSNLYSPWTITYLLTTFRASKGGINEYKIHCLYRDNNNTKKTNGDLSFHTPWGKILVSMRDVVSDGYYFSHCTRGVKTKPYYMLTAQLVRHQIITTINLKSHITGDCKDAQLQL